MKEQTYIQGLGYNHTGDQHYLVRVDRQFKCVCEMCNCGKHKCPKQKAKGNYETSYNSQFQEIKIIPETHKYRNIVEERHYNPETLQTNYQQEYFQRSPERYTPAASRLQNIGREVLRPSGKFDGVTSYKEQYQPFIVQAQSQVNPEMIDSNVKEGKSRIKFEGQSSYKQSFQPQPMPKLDRYQPTPYKSSGPFSGSSSYKNDFNYFKVQVTGSPALKLIQGRPVKFEGSSTYNNHFQTFTVIQDRTQPICRLDSLAKYQNQRR